MLPTISRTSFGRDSAIALLVEEEELHWNTRIVEILPEYKLRNDVIGREARIINVLPNRTGLSTAYAFYGQRNEEPAISKSEMTRLTCTIQAIKWNYALVTDVNEMVTGKTCGTFIKEKILSPLKMQRTSSMTFSLLPVHFEYIVELWNADLFAVEF